MNKNIINKSIITNVIAVACIVAGNIFDQHWLLTAGLFALSGAITNWLAVHMLFEKIPGLYGSGVIPARFEDFKLGLRRLMMEQFFTKENIERFLSESANKSNTIDFAPVIDKVNLAPAFDSLIDVIEQSSFGSMLAMVGGSDALIPLKEPFIEKMRVTVTDIAQSDEFTALLRDEMDQTNFADSIQSNIGDIIEQRLNELTPALVKDIIQTMIRKHLGWLVVWGGVFGGAIGVIVALTNGSY